MFFDTDLDIDGNVTITICLRTPSDKFVLFTSRPKTLTESEVLDAISNNKSAMTHIRVSHRRGHALFEDGVYIVPVTIIATPAGTPEPEQKDTDLWIPDHAAPQEQSITKATTAAQAPLVGADQIAYLKSLHEMSLQTLGQIIKSANEALSKVAQAQSDAMRAMSSHHAQAQQSFDRMSSLPMNANRHPHGARFRNFRQGHGATQSPGSWGQNRGGGARFRQGHGASRSPGSWGQVKGAAWA